MHLANNKPLAEGKVKGFRSHACLEGEGMMKNRRSGQNRQKVINFVKGKCVDTQPLQIIVWTN